MFMHHSQHSNDATPHSHSSHSDTRAHPNHRTELTQDNRDTLTDSAGHHVHDKHEGHSVDITSSPFPLQPVYSRHGDLSSLRQPGLF
jgi:hypothetical protein